MVLKRCRPSGRLGQRYKGPAGPGTVRPHDTLDTEEPDWRKARKVLEKHLHESGTATSCACIQTG